MKMLPLGEQVFRTIIKNNLLYIDKTELLYKLITTGKYYFLSRPRRFGKSLTVSTLKEIFEGNKELFKNLWIYDKYNWGKKHPVIHFDFNALSYSELGLAKAINQELDNIAGKFGLTIKHEDNKTKFMELIRQLSEKSEVAVLIDEYDKPIIDYLTDIKQAEENRDILKNFYSALKPSSAYLRFVFITGVSKFSSVSIFSDLNNLEDITIDEEYAILTGYTQDELLKYFAEYFPKLEKKYKQIYPDIKQAIRDWYDGYSWDGKNFVYNPFSILALFKKTTFDNYWFETGTPTFLIKMIKERNMILQDFKNEDSSTSIIGKYEISKLSIIPLLFQTGYLTIKKLDLLTNDVILSYPNREVEKSFLQFLLSEYAESEFANSLLIRLRKALLRNDIDKVMEFMKSIFADIAYHLIEKKEKYYHSLFYLIITLLGFDIDAEILTANGRIDAVIKSKTHIYILEFKLGDAEKALQQIKDKNYVQKYLPDDRQIVLLGIGFDTEKKNIGGYKSEIINK